MIEDACDVIDRLAQKAENGYSMPLCRYLLFTDEMSYFIKYF